MLMFIILNTRYSNIPFLNTGGSMSYLDMLLLAVGLAMDAFAVSICKGLASKERFLKTGIVCGIWFGVFQALMPFIGWLLGTTVADLIESFSAYVAFVLLAFLGIKMIYGAIKGDDETCEDTLSPRVMVVFALATSIDALAAGLSLAAVEANIWIAILFIGVITCIMSFIGSIVGAKVGAKFKSKAEIAGGVILIIIGLKILIEYLITLF